MNPYGEGIVYIPKPRKLVPFLRLYKISPKLINKFCGRGRSRNVLLKLLMRNREARYQKSYPKSLMIIKNIDTQSWRSRDD